jgi:recombinational DNA repair protein RecT
MARGRIPEGYISAQELVKKFRTEHPKSEISTSAQIITIKEEAIIVVTAVVSTENAKSSGMSQGLLREDKATEKAESSAIRRALINLGYESVEVDSAVKEDKKEERKNRFTKLSDTKKEVDNESTDVRVSQEDSSSESVEAEPKSRFKRSRFERS